MRKFWWCIFVALVMLGYAVAILWFGRGPWAVGLGTACSIMAGWWLADAVTAYKLHRWNR